MRETRRHIRFIETLGRGGFGAVYLADVHSQNDLVQRLAVKILSAEMNDVADVAARQRDEARLLAQLNHDHIVKVYDLIELDGRPAVMMEYVEGADASLLLRLGPFPPRAATALVAAAAAALEAAHEAPSPRTGQPLRVIHRDIKPANLLISRHGGVKVLDFGIARADFDREGKTTSVQYGTARYMAPEQWLFGQTTAAVDIYALGVSFVELLTASHRDRPPLDREAFETNLHSILASVVPPDGSSAGAWYDDLNDLLRDMLAFDPQDRPSAAVVHERALVLAERAPGESLARLARAHIPPLIEARRQKFANDPLPESRSFLRPETHTEALPAEARPHTASPPTQPRTQSPPLLALALVTGLMVVLGGAGISFGIYNLLQPEPAPEALAIADPTPPVEPVAAPDPTPPPPPPEEAAPEAVVVPEAIQKDPAPARSGRSSGGAPAPAPEEKLPEQPATAPPPAESAPREPEAAPAPAPAVVQTRLLSFGGPAINAVVYLDGQFLTRTPRSSIPVSYGSHTLEMHSNGEVKTLAIEVGPGSASGYVWRLGSDRIVGL